MSRLLVCAAICTVLLGISGCSQAPTGSDLLVLCDGCIPPGQKFDGENTAIMLLDQDTGEVWAYNDAAMTGTAKPIYVGKLSKLGEPLTRESSN
jgi:hypothetical protein